MKLRHLFSILPLLLICSVVHAEGSEASLTVSGHGLAMAAPDQAMVTFAVIANAKEAGAAQNEVNRTMHAATDAVIALGVAAKRLTTTGLTLQPIYKEEEGAAEESIGARISGYQASNRLEVRLEQVALVGPVIDAAVKAGVNNIDGISFGVKDEQPLRRAAIADAVRDARVYGETIAEAMGVRLLGVAEIYEQGVGPIQPTGVYEKAMVASAPAPVQAGETGVAASVTVKFRISSEIGKLATP